MSEKESNFVSVVVNLQKGGINIENFLEMIYAILKENFKKYELICVANCDCQIASEKIKKFKDEHDDLSVSIIKLDERQGLEECMNAGIDLAIGDFVFEFDSCYIDFEPSVVMEIYRKSLEGFDIVAAIPPKEKTRFSSQIFYKIYNHYSNMKELATERFRVVSRRAINRVSTYNKIIPYRKAVYASAGLETAQVNYVATRDATGVPAKDILRSKVATDSLILFTDIAYRVTRNLAICAAILMFSSGLFTVITYIGAKPVEGWAPLMGTISAGFLVLLLILAMIIKYLDLILRLLFKKQKYTVVNVKRF